MNQITLRQIDESNFLHAFRLQLRPGQEAWVSHPIRSLAQAYVYRNQCIPFGLYCGETMVGYAMVIFDYDEDCYNLWHMMIDGNHQGKGYGRDALQALMDCIRSHPFGDSDRLLLTCSPENTVAMRLYSRFGFQRTGRDDDAEIELELKLQ